MTEPSILSSVATTVDKSKLALIVIVVGFFLRFFLFKFIEVVDRFMTSVSFYEQSCAPHCHKTIDHGIGFMPT
jgi:hypothetical protein